MEEFYTRTQSMGNCQGIRWLTINDGSIGLKIISKNKLNFAAFYFYDQELLGMKHQFILDKNSRPETILSIDFMQQGFGNTLFGTFVMKKYEPPLSDGNNYSFRIEPYKK